MNNITALLTTTTLSSDARKSIEEILSTADSTVVENWLGKVEVTNGRISGTYYTEIANSISFNQFVALYQSLGYDFSLLDTWKDWRCGHGGCVHDPGWSCDPGSCTARQ